MDSTSLNALADRAQALYNKMDVAKCYFMLPELIDAVRAFAMDKAEWIEIPRLD